MGRDGVQGLTTLKRQGALILAQDEATSTVWGMPGAAVQAGLADMILPLDQLAGVIQSYRGPGESRRMEVLT
jgi:two-component system chemotaxis response regulator CheB